MAKRKGISKRLRFEIFNRDGFSCVYCGKTAADETLEIDHVVPVSKGGANDKSNLVTACFSCNRGKSDRPIDGVEPEKEKTDQILAMAKMYAKRSLAITSMVEVLENYWSEMFSKNYPISDKDRGEFRALIFKYSIDMIMESMGVAFSFYISDPNKCLVGEWRNAVKKISGICYNKLNEKNNYNK